MHLRTLGALHLEGNDAAHPKSLLLLAYLSRVGPQPRKRVARLFWPQSNDSLNRLAVTLSRMRRTFPDAAWSDGVRVGTSLRTDVDHLEDAIAGGRFAEVEGLYRGAFLDGVYVKGLSGELEDWMSQMAEMVAHRVQLAQLTAAEAAAGRGRWDRAMQLAEAAARIDGSLLEASDLKRLHTLLQMGGSPDAVRVRREAAWWSVDLDGQRGPAGGASDVARAEEDETRVEHNLRPRATSFVGRERELHELGEMLRRPEHRLVTLVGPGGVGKSRLAWQAASERVVAADAFEACWHVALAEETCASGLYARIASDMRLAPRSVRVGLEDVAAHFGERRVLLVLDDCEHLEGVAAEVSALLDRCPRVTVSATSRDRLRIAEEWCYPVGGLEPPPASSASPGADAASAVRLFEASARRCMPRFTMGPGDMASIAEICRLTGGSPLALELAAACVGVMPVHTIADELRQSLDVLGTTFLDVPDRHRTLRAGFDHTWRTLRPDDREALRRLAVFQGGFDRRMAHRVADVDAAMLASLAVVSRIVDDGPDRFDLHPLVRAYSAEALAAAPEVRAMVAARHAAYMLEIAHVARPRIDERGAGAWSGLLEVDHANLEAALEHYETADPAGAFLTLADALVPYWIRRGRHDEVLRSLRRSRRISEGSGDAEGVASEMSLRGIRHVYLQDDGRAHERYREALALAREHDAPKLVARLLDDLGRSSGVARYAEA